MQKSKPNKKGIIMVGNFPPPYSGQSISFKLCVESISERGIEFTIVDTIEKKDKISLFHRSWDYNKVLTQIFLKGATRKYSVLYSILSVSRKGLLRDYLIVLIANIMGLKIVLHSHNGCYNDFYEEMGLMGKKMISYVTNSSQKIIILSDRLLNTFYFLEDQSKLEILPNALPFELDDQREVEKKDEDKINVLFLSNLIEAKGYYDVLEAIRLLSERGMINRFEFNFAGKVMLHPKQDRINTDIKTAKNKFESMLEELNEKASLEYHGVVFGEKKVDLLKKADVFILPTYYSIEAQPITLIEAMAFGCSILSTDYRAIPEMLKDKANGFFIEEKNPVDIANKLESYNPDILRKHKKESLDLYESKFKQEIFKENFFSLMERELKQVSKN